MVRAPRTCSRSGPNLPYDSENQHSDNLLDVSPTPILDLEQAPPKPPRAWVPALIGLVIGLLIVCVIILEDQNKLPVWNWPAFNGLLIIPGLYVAIAIHELGHLAVGRLIGLDSGGVAIGGFVWLKSGKNWVFRFDRRMWIGGFFKPLANASNFRPSHYAWMVAAGPLASFVLTTICGFVAVHYGSGEWNCIGSLFWTSLFILLITVIPFSSGLQKSDGALLQMLLLHPERTRLWMSVLELQTAETNGVRPRDWQSHLFDQVLVVDAAATEYPYCQLMSYYRRLDEGEDELALGHLENLLAKSARTGKAWRHIIFLEAASASANVRKRATQARTWRERASKLRKPESLHVVDAGIAMCEQRYQEAAQHWEAARKRVDRRKLDSGITRFAKEKWAGYQAECHTAEPSDVNAGSPLLPNS